MGIMYRVESAYRVWQNGSGWSYADALDEDYLISAEDMAEMPDFDKRPEEWMREDVLANLREEDLPEDQDTEWTINIYVVDDDETEADEQPLLRSASFWQSDLGNRGDQNDL